MIYHMPPELAQRLSRLPQDFLMIMLSKVSFWIFLTFIEFIIKYLTVSISMLLTVEKPAEDNSAEGKKKKLQELSLRGKNAKAREKEKKKQELEDLTKSLKKTFIIELARKIQNLRNDEINDHLRGICLSTNRRNKELFNKLNIGILVLLKFWGDPKALSLRYISEEEDKERKMKEEHERQVALQKEEEKKQRDEANLDLVELDSNGRGTGRRMKRGGKSSSALVPYSKTPRSKIAIKALMEIDKIKLSIKEKEEIKNNEEKAMHLKIERQKRALKKKLDKRMIEHGVNYRNEQTTVHNIVSYFLAHFLLINQCIYVLCRCLMKEKWSTIKYLTQIQDCQKFTFLILMKKRKEM